jgi:flavin reductase (DIM6/NTAB) family NADH-FMN oxidoreductase RutF
MVCLHKATETFRLLSGSGVFAISILNQDQEHVSRQLALPPDSGVERLAGISIRMGRSGAPLIQGACAWMECRVVRLIRLSTHVAVIGEVRACGQRRGAPGPLLYHDRRYRRLR